MGSAASAIAESEEQQSQGNGMGLTIDTSNYNALPAFLDYEGFKYYSNNKGGDDFNYLIFDAFSDSGNIDRSKFKKMMELLPVCEEYFMLEAHPETKTITNASCKEILGKLVGTLGCDIKLDEMDVGEVEGDEEEEEEEDEYTLDEFLGKIAKSLAESLECDDEEYTKAFNLLDADGDGYIHSSDLKRVLENLGENLSESELQQMIEEADRNNDQRIDLDEFKLVSRKAISPKRNKLVRQLSKVNVKFEM